MKKVFLLLTIMALTFTLKAQELPYTVFNPNEEIFQFGVVKFIDDLPLVANIDNGENYNGYVLADMEISGVGNIAFVTGMAVGHDDNGNQIYGWSGGNPIWEPDFIWGSYCIVNKAVPITTYYMDKHVHCEFFWVVYLKNGQVLQLTAESDYN
jgi:hypothetical protein